MSTFDRYDENDRLRVLNAERDITLWDALLDAQNTQALHRIVESTIAANSWDAALAPIATHWRALGHALVPCLEKADPSALQSEDRDYAAVFFAAAAQCWAALTAPSETDRTTLRAALETAQERRRAQRVTEPLPLGLPPQSFGVRLPTLPLPGRDPRSYTVLLLRPSSAPADAAPLLQFDLGVSPEGLYAHVTPCNEDGHPMRPLSALHDAPGCTLLSATWSDLGLGDHGPYYYLHANGTRTPTLGDSFEVRYICGAQRSALLLCTQHDIVRVELADLGHALSVRLECPGRAGPHVATIDYDDRALARSHMPAPTLR